MPLADGDAAEPGDAWLRVISNPKYLKNDGTLHNGAFTGTAFREPPVNPWSLELSGNLLSLVPDIKAHGETYGLKFHGFMFQQVEKLYCIQHATDVVYTPLTVPKVDPTHADLVTYRLTSVDEDKWAFRDWLQEVLFTAKPDDLGEIEKLRKAA